MIDIISLACILMISKDFLRDSDTCFIWKMMVLLPLATLISGCSIIGLAIGEKMDKQKSSSTLTLSPNEVIKIKKGNLVEIHTTKNQVISETFLSVEPYAYDPLIDLISINRDGYILSIGPLK